MEGKVYRNRVHREFLNPPRKERILSNESSLSEDINVEIRAISGKIKARARVQTSTSTNNGLFFLLLRFFGLFFLASNGSGIP